jgi:hypothetical protein
MGAIQGDNVIKYIMTTLGEKIFPTKLGYFNRRCNLFIILRNSSIPKFQKSGILLLGTLKNDRYICLYVQLGGARGSVVVKTLCCKPKGCGFDTLRGEFLNLPNPSGRTRPWGLLSL